MTSNKKSLYVLLCEDNHFYIGKTLSSNISKRLKDHFDGNGSEWTRRYQPIKVLDTIQDIEDEDEDYYTKKYMKEYGIDNVRGGSYSQINLPDHKIKSLEDEFSSIDNVCFRCKRKGHFISSCYAKTNVDGLPIDDDDDNNSTLSRSNSFSSTTQSPTTTTTTSKPPRSTTRTPRSPTSILSYPSTPVARAPTAAPAPAPITPANSNSSTQSNVLVEQIIGQLLGQSNNITSPGNESIHISLKRKGEDIDFSISRQFSSESDQTSPAPKVPRSNSFATPSSSSSTTVPITTPRTPTTTTTTTTPKNNIKPSTSHSSSSSTTTTTITTTSSLNNLPPRPVYTNKQRILVIASRGINARYRHLLEDLKRLLPHHKKDNKLDAKNNLQSINEIAEINSCNQVLYLECRKRQDLYLHLAHTPSGPSVKFHVVNVHTMDELKLTGNAMLGSRPLLNFDKGFEKSAHLLLIKSLLSDAFGTPNGHPKSKPFVDRIMSFYVIKNKIWVRNYQILDRSERRDGKDSHLVEIGPRMVLIPIRIFNGSFGGATLYQNASFISPNEERSDNKKRKSHTYVERIENKKQRNERQLENVLPPDELSNINVFK